MDVVFFRSYYRLDNRYINDIIKNEGIDNVTLRNFIPEYMFYNMIKTILIFNDFLIQKVKAI